MYGCQNWQCSAGDSSKPTSTIVVENFRHLLCGTCSGVGKTTETTNGFSRGSLLVESRALYEYASTKGQLKQLPHIKKKWFGKDSKFFLRRQVIALSRRRFSSFDQLLDRKSNLKRKEPRKMYDSIHYQNLLHSWGCQCDDRECENCWGGDY